MKWTLKKKTLIIGTGLALCTLAVYWQVRDHEFLDYDDSRYITKNIMVQRGLDAEGLTWAFTSGYATNWHPLTWVSHMLDCELFGLDPTGHHMVNVAFHVANTILLFLILKRMTGAIWRSAFVAAVFALHPLYVESVAWASERKDLLSTLFWMLTMGAYALYTQQPTLRRYLLVFLFLALGLMAKPMLVTLPFVLLLLDYWPLQRLQLGRSSRINKSTSENRRFLLLLREKAPLIGLTVASSIVTFIVQRSGGAMGSLETVPLGDRVANAIVSYTSYIRKSLWPSDLAVFYPHQGKTLELWQVAGAAILLLGISGIVIWKIRRFRYLAVGWFWFLGTLVPVLGIVQVGIQGMADRYMYVPLIGLSIIVAWGFTDLLSKWHYQKGGLAFAATTVLLALTGATSSQISYWHDGIRLFEHAIRVTTNNYVAETNLGVALQVHGRTDEALEHYLESLRINPSYEFSHYNLGLILAGQGKTDEAITHFSEAVRLNSRVPEAHNNLGVLLAKKGKNSEAIEQFAEALQLNPAFVDARSNLGLLLMTLGKTDEAITQFNDALRLQPDNASAKNGLKEVQQLQRRTH
jgi:tetratricopeptide (TPR) repeat protein